MERPDAVLVKQILAGDTAAFDILLKRYKRPVFNLILRFVQDPNTAEDLFQDTFVRFWQQAHRFDDRRGSLVTFLYTIAANLCRSEFRRRQRNPIASLEDYLNETLVHDQQLDTHSHDGFEHRELRVVVNRALRKLPESQRMAIVMSEFDNMTYADIAGVMSCAEGTVKSLVHRGRARLRSLLLKYVEPNHVAHSSRVKAQTKSR